MLLVIQGAGSVLREFLGGLILLLVPGKHCFNPWSGVRVGEAAHPGPISDESFLQPLSDLDADVAPPDAAECTSAQKAAETEDDWNGCCGEGGVAD